ncbi:MAG: hypothetical protein FWE09_06490 [Treponema sp.]|nr:hypothetical protein [Treponema sp.]
MLAIASVAALCYALIPLAGAMVRRRSWHSFRARAGALRLCPTLGFRSRAELDPRAAPAGAFRFFGEAESLGEDGVLFARGSGLSIPVLMKGAEAYLLSAKSESPEDWREAPDSGEEAVQRIGWKKALEIAEGSRVFVGGSLARLDGRLGFAAGEESPLLVIFHDGPDRRLLPGIAWAGRCRGEYFNRATPYSLALGAVSLLFIAAYYLPYQAFRQTSIAAIIAAFAPLFPLLPTGFPFTLAYRRLARAARALRARRDLARLPLRYPAGELPDGEIYGSVLVAELPPEAGIPLLAPEAAKRPARVYGALRAEGALPTLPADPLAPFGALPADVRAFAKRCAAKACASEALAWIALLSGIALTFFFIGLLTFVLS